MASVAHLYTDVRTRYETSTRLLADDDDDEGDVRGDLEDNDFF